MSTHIQSITGRHWKTGDWIRIEFNQKKILSISSAAHGSRNAPWLAPSLLDLQVNGYGGVDFQKKSLSEASLVKAVEALNRDGCPRFFLTLTTSDWPSILSKLKRIKVWRDNNPTLRKCIAGWHVEGPFLSKEPGYCGAHDSSAMEDPNPEKIQALGEIIQTDPTLLTLAPERPGSMESILHASQLGMRVSLGHTNAGTDCLRAAASAGATGFTHLGNACPQKLDRHDNLIYRVLDSESWMTGIIPDGVHVSPALFRILHKLIPLNQIYYTTDAMSAAGAAPGRYTIGNIEVEVGDDQVVRQPGQSNFAGSALKPREGITRAARMLHTNWQDVWSHFSEIPSRWMGLSTGLHVGAPSNFSIVRGDVNVALSIELNKPA
ncbi:N-acetylglucosamine-6-phosphate deacetylase [Verrucomicrobia bacterium]|nr:N-acetylglucosamine-6-phosphate deacetylase [bacterium]MDC0299306.1 N-acetylglucosamine-6-phosphate deacetylase [Verrucomicrobiota bacterium]